ncbi:hypothetical protein N8586_00010 [Verrucomicrobiales bacterium]|nr:hypothetical protein [Verrucomicrobiales bacterium]
MNRQPTTDEARQERDRLRSSLSKPAHALVSLAEEESGLAQEDGGTASAPPVPMAIRQAFDQRFSEPVPIAGSTAQSWWRRSGPTFLAGMAAAAVIAIGLFAALPIPEREVSWSEFRGHGLPQIATERQIVYTFVGSNSLQQVLEDSWLKGEDVRGAPSEDALLTIIDDQFDSVHIVIDESNQTIRGLAPSLTTRQVQDSIAPESDGVPFDPANVYESIDAIKRACLVLVALEEKQD